MFCTKILTQNCTKKKKKKTPPPPPPPPPFSKPYIQTQISVCGSLSLSNSIQEQMHVHEWMPVTARRLPPRARQLAVGPAVAVLVLLRVVVTFPAGCVVVSGWSGPRGARGVGAGGG